METENTVSIWIGNFETKAQLDEFITLIYDEDGEIVPARFYEEYHIDIDDIDDYLIEKEVFETQYLNLYQMLKGASYENIIIENLKNNKVADTTSSSNSIILIYNYSYTGKIMTTDNTEFVGFVKYR